MRLQRVLFGYYKDRIKGSNLESHRRKVCLIGVISSVVFGVGLYYLPISYKLREKIQSGYYDDPPEWTARKAHMQMWFQGEKPQYMVRTKEDYIRGVEKATKDEFHDV